MEGCSETRQKNSRTGGSGPAADWVRLLVLLIFAAMKRWTVIALVRIITTRIGVTGVAGASQRRLLGVLGVGQAPLVLDPGEAGLDLVKLRSGDGVLIPGREDAGDLFLGVEDTVRGLGMVGKHLGHGARLALLQGLDLF